MYSIDKTPYGFKLTFGGQMSKDEMERWKAESWLALSNKSGKFYVFVDMRTLNVLDPDTQEVMINGQSMFRQAGMTRSVVILNDPDTTRQFRTLAKVSGIFHWERYIDASSTPKWEEAGLKWLTDGVDPRPAPDMAS